MSKSVIATLPPALLIVFWWKRGRLDWKKDIAPLLPFFVMGVGSGLFTAWMERTHIGAQGHQFTLSFIERCLIAGRAFWFYLAKLFWPAKLTFIYPRWHISQSIWWQYVYFARCGCVVRGPLERAEALARSACRLSLLRRHAFPGPWLRQRLPFRLLLRCRSFPIPCLHRNHCARFSLSGPVVDKLQREKATLRYFVPILVVALLAGLSWKQAHAYQDAETLYLTTLDRNPDCWLAYNNLSTIFLAKGKIDEALQYANKAVELQPEDMEPHIAAGDALLRKRRVTEAIEHYKKALTIRPDYGEGYSHLGSAYLLSNRFSEAIEQYQKTLSLAPRSVVARNNLAWLLATCADPSLRDTQRAIQLAEEADQLANGKSSLVLHTLSTAYGESGQSVKALEVANRALQLAERQGNRGLAETLRKEIKVYESQLQPGSGMTN